MAGCGNVWAGSAAGVDSGGRVHRPEQRRDERLRRYWQEKRPCVLSGSASADGGFPRAGSGALGGFCVVTITAPLIGVASKSPKITRPSTRMNFRMKWQF